MYFDSLTDFLAMGDHGVYVWSAYGISLALLLSNIWLALRSNRLTRARLARRATHQGTREES